MSQAPVPRRSDYVDDRAFIEALLAVLVERGTDWRYDEEVSQLEHACAGCSPGAFGAGQQQGVAAALLHDIGHFLMADAAQDERNRRP